MSTVETLRPASFELYTAPAVDREIFGLSCTPVVYRDDDGNIRVMLRDADGQVAPDDVALVHEVIHLQAAPLTILTTARQEVFIVSRHDVPDSV